MTTKTALSHAAQQQPAPQPGRHIVHRYVQEDIQARVEAGREKYGTPLMSHNGRDALWDAYQEAIDLVFYLRQLILERGSFVYTIGYEGLTLQQFIEKVNSHGIQSLIDVRELPLSRKPGFSKTKLSKALKEAGIQYESIRDLGSPRQLRKELRATNDWQEFSSQFLKHLQSHKGLLEQLADRAHRETICLLCFEHDSTVCHRSIVAREIVKCSDSRLDIKHL